MTTIGNFRYSELTTTGNSELNELNSTVELLLAGMSNFGVEIGDDVEDVSNFLRSQLQISLLPERLELLSPILDKPQKEEELSQYREIEELHFRVFGPRNPGTNVENDRMFLCNEFEKCDEEEETVDWFTGNCQYSECRKRILNRYCAVRRPRYDGGWIGCFCCLNHVDSSIDQGNVEEFGQEVMDGEIEEDGPEVEAIQNLHDRVYRFEKDMERIGILERRFRDMSENQKIVLEAALAIQSLPL